ncbi:hypothetical protein KY290_026130 [Solanum tuberosum]|uniref:Reverse transcriptase domain-containing protein n=1 Tax=Solanum tuberosum TaxID=4113 RepID=A0ABQ7UYL8_SOLTU|nr:hypothetical protein KY289_025225 [Solanum tuberosum]KAH0677208.1 hypothetical protein KY285_025009 [Solanum tuberosum]KAH0755860.1 hypothetical protein KY290_026130 [Solanum tuberosum]
MATTHKRFNTIDKLMVEGVSVTDSEEIKGTIISYYQNLYRETEQWRPEFNVQGAERITQEENVWLQRQFEEDEVFNCIKSCASDKAPGPDGFSMSFFQIFWEILKTDFMNAVRQFHERHEIEKKRLKKVIGKLMNNHQMAFIQGRQIMDAALIESECVDSRIKGETPGIMCKLDIEKAYDHVNWKFLLNILRQMGFGDKWLKWIGFCIKTVRFSILVNGEPAGFFPSERGLRQGDPLSPFLFILAMEGLNNMIRVANQNDWIKGFNIGNQSGVNLQICHLLYADDTLIFCDAKAEQVSYIRVVLVIFEAISGLAMNWGKAASSKSRKWQIFRCWQASCNAR